MSQFREIAPLPPQSQNRQSADIARKRRLSARLQTDARVLHVSFTRRFRAVRIGSGKQAYAAKFEPAAWSWAQMTSGSGARNAFNFEWGDIQIQTSKAKLST
jgi:hypothetical protein